MATLGLGDRNSLDQVVQELMRLVALDERRVAEDARVVNRQSWGGADSAIHLCGGYVGDYLVGVAGNCVVFAPLFSLV